MKNNNWFKKHPVLTGIISVVILFVIIGMFSGGDNNTPTNTQSNKNTEKNPDLESSAIEMMEVAFIGDYSQGEIKTLLDVTMQLNSLPITEENYQRLGSVLVTLRKEIGVSEMDILTCMKAADYRNSVGGNITPEKAVGESAAICATLLA